MGYYTKYELSVEPPTPGAIEAARQAGSGEGGDCLTEDGMQAPAVRAYANTNNKWCKWYLHEYDLKIASIQFPDVVFHLKGDGEKAGDIWEKDFKAGKIQVRKAELVIPPFDPDRWE